MDKMPTVCLAFGLALGGCSVVQPVDTAEENSISVSDAMQDIGLGFYKLNAEVSENPNLQLGLYACEVTVNFNISATRTKDGKLAIGVSSPLKVARVNGSYNSDSSFSVDRGNTVSVTMESSACLDRDILVAEAGGNKTSTTATTTPTTKPTTTPTTTTPPHNSAPATPSPTTPDNPPIGPATMQDAPYKLPFAPPPGYVASYQTTLGKPAANSGNSN